MKVYRDVSSFNVDHAVLTIGSFDGVHKGHVKVIERLKKLAEEKGGESVIFTFFPHPRLVLYPEEGNLRLLTTLEEKIQLFEEAGLDHLIIFPFTKEFSKLTYDDFVKKVLIDQLKIKYLVVGHDHKFGKNREGGYEMLIRLSKSLNFQLEQIDVLLADDIEISSTKIRDALQEGNVTKANKYLGYPFTLHGTVVEGQKLGRKIQFPTANVEASDPNKIIPGHGVYAVWVKHAGATYGGMLNIGTRPTVNKNADQRSIEVHIFDFEQDIYNDEIELKFVAKVREEKKFDSVEELTEQLHQDKITVSEILADRGFLN